MQAFFRLALVPIALLITLPVYANCSNMDDQAIQNIINADREKYAIPAVEVSIICPGENTSHDFASGTTTMGGDTPVSPDHLFQIGSETKSFVSVILLQLEAAGKLSIQDPIGKYLPNLPEDWKNITITQLLNHTSGIANYTDAPGFHDEIMQNFSHLYTADELVNRVSSTTPKAPPVLYYSNTDAVLAGMIIESVTHQSVADEMNQRIFKPLQMNHTYYLPVITYSPDQYCPNVN